jgi:hypothetical protein
MPPHPALALAKPVARCLFYNIDDFKTGKGLTMTLCPAVIFSPFLFKDSYLFVAILSEDLPDHLGLFQPFGVQRDPLVILQEEDRSKFDLITGVAVTFFHLYNITRCDPVLFSPCFHYRMHFALLAFLI